MSLNVQLGALESFFDSISTEKGWSLSGAIRLRRPELGGEDEAIEFTYTGRTYVPLWSRHVLALRFDGAIGRAANGTRAFYSLGPLQNAMYSSTPLMKSPLVRHSCAAIPREPQAETVFCWPAPNIDYLWPISLRVSAPLQSFFVVSNSQCLPTGRKPDIVGSHGRMTASCVRLGLKLSAKRPSCGASHSMYVLLRPWLPNHKARIRSTFFWGAGFKLSPLNRVRESSPSHRLV